MSEPIPHYKASWKFQNAKRAKKNGIHVAFANKHVLGDNPCGNCGVSRQHKNCRPKLDGSLCTCSCEKSLLIRETYKQAVLDAIAEGREIPKVEDVVRDIVPRYKQLFT